MKFKILCAVLLSFCIQSAQAEIKNSQNLLGGMLTRAGVKNQKPLSQQELVSLCEQGYTKAFYLYSGAPTTQVSCSKGTIRYQSSGTFFSPENIDKTLDNIESGMRTREKTFVHCNNGAHASGFVAAIALRTFCGISGDQAVKYWDKTLKGYDLQEPNRPKLMSRIRNYQPRSNLKLNEGQRSAFGCSNF